MSTVHTDDYDVCNSQGQIVFEIEIHAPDTNGVHKVTLDSGGEHLAELRVSLNEQGEISISLHRKF